MSGSPPIRCTVRRATQSDSNRLAELASQLGYPSEGDRIAAWLNAHESSSTECVFVAVCGIEIVGWTSVSISDHFYTQPCAEISGLIVDSAWRSQGIGRQLLQRVETWAESSGLTTIRLRANSVRKDAHRFYCNNGFQKTKEQFVFVKKSDKL